MTTRARSPALKTPSSSALRPLDAGEANGGHEEASALTRTRCVSTVGVDSGLGRGPLAALPRQVGPGSPAGGTGRLTWRGAVLRHMMAVIVQVTVRKIRIGWV